MYIYVYETIELCVQLHVDHGAKERNVNYHNMKCGYVEHPRVSRLLLFNLIDRMWLYSTYYGFWIGSLL